MTRPRVEWARWAGDLAGPRFAEFQTQLAGHNAHRFRPGLPEEAASDELATDERVGRAEIEMVEALRRAVAPLIAEIPAEPMDSSPGSSNSSTPALGRVTRSSHGSRPPPASSK